MLRDCLLYWIVVKLLIRLVHIVLALDRLWLYKSRCEDE